MKVLLLAGGVSSEREVSLASGAAVCDALMHLGHEVHAIDPATGHSLLGRDGKFITSPASGSTTVDIPQKLGSRAVANTLDALRLQDVDVVFIGLHGGVGENGAIQCLLELAGIAYTGSNMTASAVAMDKAIAKRLFVSAKILTPDWELYRLASTGIDDRLVEEICRRFSLPVIIKPNDSGSTIGLSKVDNEAGLRPAFRAAIKESRNVLVEKYSAGRELTVAVLDGQALPVVEIKASSGLYDYDAKYTKGKSEYIVPAEIEPGQTRILQEAAARAYQAMGCSGLVRVDFILAEDGQHYCLEVNTIPGMTSLSLAPMAAKAAGIEFNELISRIIQSALNKQQE